MLECNRCAVWKAAAGGKQPAAVLMLSGSNCCQPESTAAGPQPLMSTPPPHPHRSLFATHYHGLTQEPALAALVQLAHMEAAVDPRRGLLPSYRLAPGGPQVRGGRGCGHSGPAGACKSAESTALCHMPCLPPWTSNPTPHGLIAHPRPQGPPPWGPVAWLWRPPASCRPVWWSVPLRWQSVRSRLAGQRSGLHCWPALRQAAPVGSLWLSSTPASSRGCRRQPSGSGWRQQQARQRQGAAPVWR